MDAKAILQLYDQEMRQDAAVAGATVYQRHGLTFFTTPPPSPLSGWVIYTQLGAAEADQAIEDIIAFFKQFGGEFEWKVYDHDAPSDLRDRLLARGFVSEDVEAVLALDLETVPPAFWEPAAGDVRRLSDPGQLAEVARIETEVWAESFSDLADSLGAEMQAGPDQISIYIAYAEGEPASSAWIRYYPQRRFAELYGGATLERHRGRGLYTALVKARAQEARQRGVRFLMVDASAMSRPVLEKLGFVFLTYSQPFVLDVGGAPTSEAKA